MKRTTVKRDIYHKILGSISTYALKNWDSTDNHMNILQTYIKQTESIDIEVKDLDLCIMTFKDQIKYPIEITNSKAVLLTKDNIVKIYRFGSETCPKCGRYKNYEKACSHCDHIEFYHN
jgi:isocitrate dehydrogenase